jgi:beta-xylosidase
VDVTRLGDGDRAGLCVLQQHYGYVGVKGDGERKSVVMVRAGPASPVDVEAVPLEQSVVHLRVDCDYRDRTDEARFYYSLDGKTWKAIGTLLHMKYTLPHFMGYRYGLFHFATRRAGGSVDFDFFSLQGTGAPG